VVGQPYVSIIDVFHIDYRAKYIALSFFGCFCIAIGYAITPCTFFPRFIGLLLIV
jgi:hypothetical protein